MSLTSISPIDGRYASKTTSLVPYFSEYALFKYRVLIEIEYLIELEAKKILEIKPNGFKAVLEKIYENFSVEDAEKIKEIERVTNHDVKAVEYFIKEKVKAAGIEMNTEFIHFGLTSQDINNTAIPLSLKHFIYNEYIPQLDRVVSQLSDFSTEWKNVSMLAHTHGQPASPTTLGKEIMVFIERLTVQKKQLEQIPFSAKFGGATGNFNAHRVAFPAIDWVEFGNSFCARLGLSRSQYTTQIEHYDNLAALFDCSKRINTILLDLCRDFWSYISMEYFKQKIKAGEIGSSAMPHKVNPIDFENAEGNLGVANALFEHFAAKLPISRLQRDLTDSTVLRNVGVPYAHTIISFESILKGLSKLLLNEAALHNDLENNWMVVAEAIQTILRRENFPNPYEALKDLTRKNQKISQKEIHEFIDALNVSETIKLELKQITPQNYTGIGL